ncbi:Alpha/Beta hydrolase protein [Penicillium antarcticum]|uniref:Alpha/Beta hydrolase protein n=1 Tax=Penicillium antarcticum TaxID=416450 RepID=UPI00238A11EE|nr:Alpha/Beta hydrolase protein [Penicillium antarcticum]KAJ5317829.1 Alpha/Beta hydrolase protein [Penicillium antarcticum]
MIHGLAGIRYFLLPPFAAQSHEAGFAVLLYVNQNWSDSDGEPRQGLNAALQQTYLNDAFNYAVILPGVDPEWIAYWAALVQALAVFMDACFLTFKGRIVALFQDGAHVVAGWRKTRKGALYCPQSGRSKKSGSAPILFPDVHAYESFGDVYECGCRWENWATEQIQLHMLEFEAQAIIHRVSPTALLILIPGSDTTV